MFIHNKLFLVILAADGLFICNYLLLNSNLTQYLLFHNGNLLNNEVHSTPTTLYENGY